MPSFLGLGAAIKLNEVAGEAAGVVFGEVSPDAIHVDRDPEPGPFLDLLRGEAGAHDDLDVIEAMVVKRLPKREDEFLANPMRVESARVLVVKVVVDKGFRGVDPDGLKLPSEVLSQRYGVDCDVVMVIDEAGDRGVGVGL